MMYTWQVWKTNRLVGYVISSCEKGALEKAHHKYGTNLYVLKTSKVLLEECRYS